MKKTFYLFLILSSNFCFSQFAIIHDADGYVNVRSSAKIANNISDKLDNGFVVYYFEPQGNWSNVDYQKNGKDLHGYIYKDKFKDIASFKKIPLKSNINGKAILFNKTIKIELTETKFIKANHKFKFLDKDSDIVIKIDNLGIFGTDGGIPKTEYKSIDVQIKNEKIEIPASALKNLFEPNLEYSEAYYDEANNILYIQALNGDGAGGYTILWIIEWNKYKSRVEASPF